jgi:hypothetical protein
LPLSKLLLVTDLQADEPSLESPTQQKQATRADERQSIKYQVVQKPDGQHLDERAYKRQSERKGDVDVVPAFSSLLDLHIEFISSPYGLRDVRFHATSPTCSADFSKSEMIAIDESPPEGYQSIKKRSGRPNQ